MRTLSLALVILITGCVSTRAPLEVDSSKLIDSWQMKGRLAATIDRQGGSATFIWDRQKDQHNIELYGPLGSGRVFLTEVNGVAGIRDKDSFVTGESLEQVLYENIGWLVPFEAINYWVTGKPDPGSEVSNQQYDDTKLVGFEQSGWQVDYQTFKSFTDTTLPAKISIKATQSHLTTLSQDLNKPIGKVSVKLIIKDFTGS